VLPEQNRFWTINSYSQFEIRIREFSNNRLKRLQNPRAGCKTIQQCLDERRFKAEIDTDLAWTADGCEWHPISFVNGLIIKQDLFLASTKFPP
jgi:hypothetical protein